MAIQSTKHICLNPIVFTVLHTKTKLKISYKSLHISLLDPILNSHWSKAFF